MRQVGITGKPNTGKSTFFSSSTMIPVKIANYPFTTVQPNRGIAYIKVRDVSGEFDVTPNPVNSFTIGHWRFVPVELVDLPGLVPGAHEGRGLGNMFLTEVSNADVLIHILDASGTTDEEGRIRDSADWDVLKDVDFLEREYDYWLQTILRKSWDKITRQVESKRMLLAEAIFSTFSGIFKRQENVESAIVSSDLPSNPRNWSDEKVLSFCSEARKLSKATLLVANKSDLPEAEKNINRLRERGYVTVPCSAEAELVLRKAARSGIIEYIPGEHSFKIREGADINEKQKEALEIIERRVFEKWGTTGVQDAINKAYLELLDMITVYPVQDCRALTDSKGNILPDAYIIPRGSTIRQLAFSIHTDLGNNFLYGIDCRTMTRLGEEHVLKNNDVISILSASRTKK